MVFRTSDMIWLTIFEHCQKQANFWAFKTDTSKLFAAFLPINRETEVGGGGGDIERKEVIAMKVIYIPEMPFSVKTRSGLNLIISSQIRCIYSSSIWSIFEKSCCWLISRLVCESTKYLPMKMPSYWASSTPLPPPPPFCYYSFWKSQRGKCT